MTDRTYWDDFYRTAHADIEKPSTFALWCRQRLEPGRVLVEFGCGNGRDAIFFAHEGLRVIACDQSEIAIRSLAAKSYASCTYPPTFVVGDFSRLEDRQFGPVDVVYSRFTLHAVTQSEASLALAWSARNLENNGKLLIEVRSVAGSLYGKGEAREKDAFVYNGHYRRFVRMNELSDELERLGFVIDDAVESAGLAVHENDDPVVIRIVARRVALT